MTGQQQQIAEAPLTTETRGKFGTSEFREMKATGCFINVGRGGTVQESTLVEALKQGWIAGAGLEVYETEPLPQNSEVRTQVRCAELSQE